MCMFYGLKVFKRFTFYFISHNAVLEIVFSCKQAENFSEKVLVLLLFFLVVAPLAAGM